MLRVTQLLVSTVLFLLTLPAAAAIAQDGPAGRYLKSRHDDVNRILGRSGGNQAQRERRTAQISRIVGQLLDYEWIAHAALGPHWEARTEEQRAEFSSLLRQLVERSYQGSLENTAAYQVRFQGEEADDGAVLVHTTARSRTNRRAPEVSIDYRMRQEGDRWVVVDIITDGVSMVRNYRNQFNRIIRRDGWDGLVQRMRDRAGSEESL